MCLPETIEEVEENMEDPNYCLICGCNRDDIRVDEHVCVECQEGDNHASKKRK